jgi:hypothetical protein
MLMMVLGIVFDGVHFEEGTRQIIASSLLAGSILFPLAVILQTYQHGALLLKALAIVGPGLVIAALMAAAWGFVRTRSTA